MDRITRTLEEGGRIFNLQVLKANAASLAIATFQRCRMKHENLVLGANGIPIVFEDGAITPPVCPMRIRENSPACPHHYDFRTPVQIIPNALRTMEDIVDGTTLRRIQQLRTDCEMTSNELRELDTKRNFLSRREFNLRSRRSFTENAERQIKVDSDAIDTEYDLLFAKMQKIHAETRALVRQAIGELSGLPQELQPAL